MIWRSTATRRCAGRSMRRHRATRHRLVPLGRRDGHRGADGADGCGARTGAAIDTGDVVGGRGWRTRQREITDAALDSDQRSRSGQTWRTTITTERIGSRIDEATRRSDELGRLRSRVGNRLLHPIDPLPDAAERLAPITWLLQRFWSEQQLTLAAVRTCAVLRALPSHRRPEGFRQQEPTFAIARTLRNRLAGLDGPRRNLPDGAYTLPARHEI